MSTPKTTIDDGGPAFPCPKGGPLIANPSGECYSLDSYGMSLRDHFAGRALAGILASYSNVQNIASVEDRAKEAYAQADAMLVERKKGRAS